MKMHIKTVLSLTVICAVITVLLAVTNAVTEPIIKKQEDSAVSGALKEVLPEGENFEQPDISDTELPATIQEVYSESNGGYVFKLKTAGYGSDLILMCGIDSHGVVKGVRYISGNETLGVETTYGEKLLNATADTLENIDTVAGATKTTTAFKNAVKDALNAAVILGGGSVDIRDEATILNDNLKEALPQSDGKFTEIFIAEDVTDISAVYSADNGAGFVFVSNEKFIAANLQGELITELTAEENALITPQIQLIVNSNLTEIDITEFTDMPPHVQNVYKTSGGNYVFSLRAAGYGINGDKYTRSGEYIYIHVSITPDGKIISCKTVEQKESEGIGDACAKPEFYKQFNGKTVTDYSEIDAISGATITTNGYKNAVASVFTAINIIEGGAR